MSAVLAPSRAARSDAVTPDGPAAPAPTPTTSKRAAREGAMAGMLSSSRRSSSPVSGGAAGVLPSARCVERRVDGSAPWEHMLVPRVGQDGTDVIVELVRSLEALGDRGDAHGRQ